MRHALLYKAIDQFREIEAAGHMPELGAQAQKILAHLGLGDDIQVAPQRKLKLAATEQVQVARQLADRAARALRNRVKLALVRSEQGENAIGLAQVAAFENDRFAGVAMLLAHTGWS